MRYVFLSLVFLFTGAVSLMAGEKKDESSVPELNKKIVSYVKSVINTQVGRGECWDLAAQALDRNNAKWDHRYKYGKEINPKSETIYPGDIIQFEGVKVKYRRGNSIYDETMEHHTAVVYEVKDDGVYTIAHQNNGFSGKNVGLSEFDMKTVVKGKLKFYRPQEGK